jgi:hypothetical protein
MPKDSLGRERGKVRDRGDGEGELGIVEEQGGGQRRRETEGDRGGRWSRETEETEGRRDAGERGKGREEYLATLFLYWASEVIFPNTAKPRSLSPVSKLRSMAA